jgi:hypothetical protein
MSQEDDGVREATMALKGMLGIGGGAEQASSVPAATTVSEDPQPVKKNKKKKEDKSRSPIPTKQNQNEPKKNVQTSNKKGKQKKAGDQQKPQQQHERKSAPPPKSNEVFAWSAFQASPDASALPIPAFTSPTTSLNAETDGTVNELDAKLTALLTGTPSSNEHRSTTSEPPPPELLNAPRAEDLEAQVIAEAVRAAAANASEAGQAAETQDNKEDEPVSESGINLAAIAASPPTKPSPAVPPPQNVGNLPPPTPFSSPAQYSNLFPPQHNPYQMQPDYVTIQVQVPPILPPDRRMVVPSPAGYPVQIIVPDGVPPGMVIPVHVPAGPLMQQHSPYGGGYPPHMSPYGMNSHQHYHHQQQHYQGHHQPPPQNK